MARLTSDHWAAVRAAWEASPRQGLTWLTKAGGGRWDVTDEAIRRRRIAEHREKPATPASLAREARQAADPVSAARARAERETGVADAPLAPRITVRNTPR